MTKKLMDQAFTDLRNGTFPTKARIHRVRSIVRVFLRTGRKFDALSKRKPDCSAVAYPYGHLHGDGRARAALLRIAAVVVPAATAVTAILLTGRINISPESQQTKAWIQGPAVSEFSAEVAPTPRVKPLGLTPSTSRDPELTLSRPQGADAWVSGAPAQAKRKADGAISDPNRSSGNAGEAGDAIGPSLNQAQSALDSGLGLRMVGLEVTGTVGLNSARTQLRRLERALARCLSRVGLASLRIHIEVDRFGSATDLRVQNEGKGPEQFVACSRRSVLGLRFEVLQGFVTAAGSTKANSIVTVELRRKKR